MKKIKIMIAEDHPAFLKLLARELETDDMTVIGAAPNGKILLELIQEKKPDIIVLDLEMPVMNGEGVLKNLAKYKTIRPIIYSQDYSEFYATSLILNGARAYLKKDTDIPELMKAIRGVYREGYFFNQYISKEILTRIREDKKKLYYLIGDIRFSERQIDILQLLCNDVPIDEIAEQMNISRNTVKHHKKSLFDKTESASMVSLIKYAITHGIVKY